jgi:hypothetical protein
MTEEQKKIADSWLIAARLSLVQALEDVDSMTELKHKWLRLTARYMEKYHPNHLRGFRMFNAEFHDFFVPSDIEYVGNWSVSIVFDFGIGFALLRLSKRNSKVTEDQKKIDDRSTRLPTTHKIVKGMSRPLSVGVDFENRSIVLNLSKEAAK